MVQDFVVKPRAAVLLCARALVASRTPIPTRLPALIGSPGTIGVVISGFPDVTVGMTVSGPERRGLYVPAPESSITRSRTVPELPKKDKLLVACRVVQETMTPSIGEATGLPPDAVSTTRQLTEP